MPYHLAPHYYLKRLEAPSLYNVVTDDLYELDEEGFAFLERCSEPEGAIPEGQEDFVEQCMQEGILREGVGTSSPQKAAQSPLPSLRYLELQITRQCNLRCAHCFVDTDSKAEMPLADVLKVIREFDSMQGLRLLVTGGEPTLHSDFDKLNAALAEFGVRRVLFSNGTMLSAERIRALNFHELQVSIDGLLPGHEALRGKGTYDRAMAAVRAALEVGMPVSISTMVHKDNLTEFEEMDRMFSGMGIRDWTVDIPTIADPAKRLAPETAGKFLEFGFGEGLHGGPAEGQACGYHLMSVMADGRCAKCAFYTGRAVGDSKEGLLACWLRLQRPALSETKCSGCQYLVDCRGGCRYRAETLEGPGGCDLYKCRSYGKI